MINLYINEDTYKDIESLSVEEDLIIAEVDEKKSVVYTGENEINVIVVERPQYEEFSPLDKLMSDIEKLISIYGYKTIKSSVGTDGKIVLTHKLDIDVL